MGKPTKKVLAGGMDMSSTLAQKREEDKEYMQSFHQIILARFKSEKKDTIEGSKAFEPYFGKTYTALYNTIPVTIKFDGTKQVYPESVANWLRKKILRVVEANTPTVQNDELSQ